MKKHIVFDFDGTLLNTDRLIMDSWQAVFRHFTGKEASEDIILATFGETVAKTMNELFPNFDQEEGLKVYRGYQERHCDGAYSLYQGVVELIDELRERGYTTSIVTSRLGNTTMRYLEELSIKDRFDVIVTADDVEAHKPDPEPLLFALEKLEAMADEAIMLGDTRFDIGCCHNAGVESVLVEWGHRIVESALGGLEPTYRINKPEELLAIIEG